VLLQRINAAEKFIYLENYAVHDESLIKAIGQRIAVAKNEDRRFDVIIVAHSPNELYSWLHWITYQHLSFMTSDSFTTRDGRTIRRNVDGRRIWRVGPYAGDYYQDTKVYWDEGSTELANIESFSPDQPLYEVVYRGTEYYDRNGLPKTPPVWVHSKVAIFDDMHAAIGSANFNPRSMKLDGEVTVFLRGQPVVDFRERLWLEHWVGASGRAPRPQEWAVLAREQGVSLSDMPADKSYVVPLHSKDFPIREWSKVKGKVSSFADATWY
jgi:phosphatidylserine/phosphatidylglycerophosphate/cardiolipin synthase-like enzyme